MTSIKPQNLACPIDGEPLIFKENQLICNNGHTFDISRQGYINLLPVQHKRSKEPGDSKEMVLARTLFLDSGLYQPIATKLSDIISSQITEHENKNICLLDAGCGEGYYFDVLFNKLNEIKSNNTLSFIGLDISKHAVLAASKRNKQITWLVGTNRQPPLSDNSVDIIMCIFGFQSLDGFNKILKPGGKIILVEPGEDHLKELREIIYQDVKKTEPPAITNAEQLGFSIVATEHLQFQTPEINNALIKNLLLMTPHFFRAHKAGREAAIALRQLTLSVDVVFRILMK